jgi:uncharacterized protein YcbX
VTTVSQLWRYPVKSMAGELLTETEARPGVGLASDREWAVRDPHNQLLVTAKRNPRILFGWASADSTGTVRIGLPGLLDPVRAEAAGEAVSAWLGQDVELVAWADRRATDSFDFGYPLDDGAGSFADEANLLHLVTTSTLAWVAEHTGDATAGSSVRRLRPNIVINGPTFPFAEDDWLGRTLEIGGSRMRVVSKTARCNVIDQSQPGDLANDGLLELVRETRGSTLGAYARVIRGGRLAIKQSVRVSPPP